MAELIRAGLQGATTVALGVLLWTAWRAVDRRSRRLGTLAAAGFLLRAVGGQLAFWTSYLELPVARSLQRGNGLWFFGIDGFLYLRAAAEAASGGLREIAALSDAPSVVYVKALAAGMWLCGPVPSTALLLNLEVHVGTVLLVVRWGERRHLPASHVAIAVAALALQPAAVLWSLQPLKDTLFYGLIVAFCWALDSLVAALSTARLALPHDLVAAGVALASLYGLAGIRWYFASAVGAAGALAMLATLLTRARAGALALRLAFAGSLVMLFPGAIVAGAGSDLPPAMQPVLGRIAFLAPRTAADEIASVAAASRANLDSYADATTRIRPGAAAGAARDASAAERSSDTLAPPANRTPSVLGERPRLVAGLAALVLPRVVGQRLGLLSVGGGRGLWWFAELDTATVDLLLAVVVLLAARGRGAWSREGAPLAAFLFVSALLVAVALASTVSNFGTLLRLRGMVVVLLALGPLALHRRALVVASAADADAATEPRAA